MQSKQLLYIEEACHLLKKGLPQNKWIIQEALKSTGKNPGGPFSKFDLKYFRFNVKDSRADEKSFFLPC